MATISMDLPPTPSYPARGLFWVPADDAGTVTHGDDDDAHQLAALGKLACVVCTGQVGPKRKVNCTTYAVQPVATGRPDVASFLLLKLTAPGGAAEVYEVTGGANGRRCTCSAGATGKGCKHLDSIAALVKAGHLPGPKSPAKPR